MSKKLTLSRRRLLGLAVAGIACLVCADLVGAAAQAASGHGTPWIYEGPEGPAHWGNLSADFKVRKLGPQQTPIDIRAGTRAELASILPDSQLMPLKILNNGHTIPANCAPGSRTVINGDTFELLQFHFHHPSEHLLTGKAFEMELHFVHKSAADRDFARPDPAIHRTPRQQRAADDSA